MDDGGRAAVVLGAVPGAVRVTDQELMPILFSALHVLGVANVIVLLLSRPKRD